ncbi:MAG: IS4 family transposase [Adhaeribacter sp.]
MEESIFSNIRLERRVKRMVERIVEKQSVVIHQISEDEAEQRSYYRLLHNRGLETGHIISYLQQDCARQVESGKHYLVFQDTTQPNFERNRANISDQQQLGVIGDKQSLGFFLHPSLVVAADNGRCLGYSHVQVWSRAATALDRKQRQYQKQPIEEKESYRWIQAAQASKQVLEKAGQLTVICDREGDIGELFLQVPDHKTHLLVRSNADRLIANGASKLSTLLASLPEGGRYCLQLSPEARSGRVGREAVLALRWAKVTLLLKAESKSMYVVEAKEVDAPAGQVPVYWRLLTTHAIQTQQQAQQLIYWYSLRWNMEQVFRLLKQKGLQVEMLDLETGKALVQLTLLALFAASKIMLLHLASKQKEAVPLAESFTQQEVACMQALHERYEGKTEKQQNPYAKDSLQWCYWIIARLGGWKPHEKQAGVITLYRGWNYFQHIFHGWTLAHKFLS